jgi:hypothetical protein
MQAHQKYAVEISESSRGGKKKVTSQRRGGAGTSQETCLGPIAQVKKSIRGILQLYKLIFFIISTREDNIKCFQNSEVPIRASDDRSLTALVLSTSRQSLIAGGASPHGRARAGGTREEADPGLDTYGREAAHAAV